MTYQLLCSCICGILRGVMFSYYLPSQESTCVYCLSLCHHSTVHHHVGSYYLPPRRRPGIVDIETPLSIHLSVRPSRLVFALYLMFDIDNFYEFLKYWKKCVNFFFLISCFLRHLCYMYFQDLKKKSGGGEGGGGGVVTKNGVGVSILFSVMLFPTFNKNYVFWGNIEKCQFKKIKICGGRSRPTELPCSIWHN